MVISEHFAGAQHEKSETYVSHELGRRINMAKVMGLSILAYATVPVLIFFAADRAFEGNWPGVLGFLLDAAGCALLAKMTTWASRNL
jgi:hypothetical protein